MVINLEGVMKNNYTELDNPVGASKNTMASPNFGLLSFGCAPSQDGVRSANVVSSIGHSRVASYSTKDATSVQPSVYGKSR